MLLQKFLSGQVVTGLTTRLLVVVGFFGLTTRWGAWLVSEACGFESGLGSDNSKFLVYQTLLVALCRCFVQTEPLCTPSSA